MDEAKQACLRKEKRRGSKAFHKKQNRHGAHKKCEKCMYWQNQKRYVDSAYVGKSYVIFYYTGGQMMHPNIVHRLLVELN